jgi:hypothetical protein
MRDKRQKGKMAKETQVSLKAELDGTLDNGDKALRLLARMIARDMIKGNRKVRENNP